jgi:hypothetical protein
MNGPIRLLSTRRKELLHSAGWNSPVMAARSASAFSFFRTTASVWRVRKSASAFRLSSRSPAVMGLPPSSSQPGG